MAHRKSLRKNPDSNPLSTVTMYIYIYDYIIYVHYGGGLNSVDTGYHIFKTFTSSHLDSEALWYFPFDPIAVQPIEFLTTWLLSSSHRLLHRGSPYFARSSCHTICWIYITTSIIIHLLRSPCLFCWINAVLKSRPIAIHLDISAHEISCAVPKRFIQTRVWLKNWVTPRRSFFKE